MNARKSLSALLISLALLLAAPGPGWGGGSDIILGNNNHGSNGNKLSYDPTYRASHRMAPAPPPQRQEPQSWLSWVWSMIRELWGERFRSSGPTPY